MRRRVFLISGICLTAIGSQARVPRAADLPRLAILTSNPSTEADPVNGRRRRRRRGARLCEHSRQLIGPITFSCSICTGVRTTLPWREVDSNL